MGMLLHLKRFLMHSSFCSATTQKVWNWALSDVASGKQLTFLGTLFLRRNWNLLPWPRSTTDNKHYILLHFGILVKLFPTYVLIYLSVEIIISRQLKLPLGSQDANKLQHDWSLHCEQTSTHIFDSMLPVRMGENIIELASQLLKPMKTNQEHVHQEHLRRSNSQNVFHLWKRITALFMGFGK